MTMKKVTNFEWWPKPVYNGIPSKSSILEKMDFTFYHFKFPEAIMNYVLQFYRNPLSMDIIELGLGIGARYLKQLDYRQPLQLVILICLHIASKTLDNGKFTCEDIHRVSNHCFTNRGTESPHLDIAKKQHQILNTIKYQLSSSSLCSQMVTTCAAMLAAMVEDESQTTVILDRAEDVQIYLWNVFYTANSEPQPEIHKYIPIAILQITLFLKTHVMTKIPQIFWLADALNLQQSKLDTIIQQLLKLVLRDESQKILF